LTGTLPERWDATATLLPNGKLLVAGGRIPAGEPLSTAYLYDSAKGNWSNAASMEVAHDFHTATLLPTGDVLVAGGLKTTGTGLKTSELYDELSGTWSQTGDLVNGRQLHTATLLTNGKVLVAGGYDSVFGYSAELYDPSRGDGHSPAASTRDGKWVHGNSIT
jgi:hypothetical protein